jgi:hypothetical protein
MPVDVVCHGCGNAYKVSRKLVGKRVRCKGCGGGIEVQGAGAVKEAAAEEGAVAGDYDLSALAAAENAAPVLIEPVYMEPEVKKPEKKMPRPGVTTVHMTGRVGGKVQLTGWRWWLAQPWPYAQVIGIGMVVAALVGNLQVAETALYTTALATFVALIWGNVLLWHAAFPEKDALSYLAAFVPLIFTCVVLMKVIADPRRFKEAGLVLANAALLLMYVIMISSWSESLNWG